MKKTLVLVIVTMFASTTLCVQARALGGRSFYIGEAVSYQHQLTEKTMLEAELGLSLSSVGVEALVTHDWLFPISSWKKTVPGIGMLALVLESELTYFQI